eukprot:9028539-Pyramimonas_sp.AAC.1
MGAERILLAHAGSHPTVHNSGRRPRGGARPRAGSPAGGVHAPGAGPPTENVNACSSENGTDVPNATNRKG